MGGGKKVKKPKKYDHDLSPMSAELISAGRKVTEPFNSVELATAAICSRKSASNAITRWTIRGWIHKADYGRYTRTKGFGAASESTEESAKKSPAPLPPAQPVPAPAGDSEKLTPYSTKGIDLAKQLKAGFSMEELASLLPQGKQQAYYFVAQWRNKNWVEKEDVDVYRKTKTFGQ